MSFLPENYEQPKGGGSYTRLALGETRIHIISDSITGWEAWTSDNKPIRVKPEDKSRLFDRNDLKVGEKPKHFWAFLIWNYNTDKIEIFEVTQRTIQNAILALYNQSDWGDPKAYDMVITKSGEGLDTEYAIQGSPKSQFKPQKVKEYFHNNPCNIHALYDGDDPFELDDITKATVIQSFDKAFNDLAF